MTSERCAACKGPYSEVTGHRHTANVVLCGPCARDFAKWVKAQVCRRWGGLRFYDYTETSRNKTVGKGDGL